jgi:sulfoxide reductase heme-binding subunit YedZ
MRRWPGSGLALAAHLVALCPLAWIIWDGLQNQLTFNPIREITLRTGKAGLVLLMLSLAAAPVGVVLRGAPVAGLRRTLGLYAFVYACLHALSFVGLDYRFDLRSVAEELSQKRFVAVGMAAFLTLLPLAVTSTQAWKRRLGRNWKRLHRLSYVAALLAAVHFLWQAKGDVREPTLYGALVVALLAARVLAWRQGRVARHP